MQKCSRLAALACLFSVLAGLRVLAAPAAGSAEAFYRGKTVTIVVGFAPGGGYDLYARLLARYLGRYLPGQPTVIVQNMPGAGSLVAANYLFNAAPKDGTVIGTFAHPLIVAQLAGGPEVQFDARRFAWVGSMTSEPDICVARADSPVRRFEDLFAKPLRVAVSGPRSATAVQTALLNGVLGTKMEPIAGYQGSADMDLALERGEVQGRCGMQVTSLLARHPEWLDPNRPFVRILVQLGSTPHKAISNVPVIMQFARDERSRTLLNSAFVTFDLSRPYTAPPGVPVERLAALRRAFSMALRDPNLLKEAAEAGLEISDPLSGEEVAERVRRALDIPDEYAAELAKYLR